MYIIEILKERVKNELRIELMIELSGQLNEEDLSQLIESKLSKMDDILPKQGDKPLDPTKCHARAWTGKRGCQCTSDIKDKKLCKRHLNQIETKNYLGFGRYDEERPVINEKCNLIPWIDDIESIDTIVRYQRMNIHK